MMNPSNTQPLPPVVKSTGKTKVKAKTETLRDDESLASDQDVIVNAQSQYTSADASQDVLLAQANTSSSAPSAPSSVGEDLLRQAGPVNSKISATEAGITDFIPKGWGLPLAIGGGALALVAAASGGGGGGDNNSASINPNPPVDPIPQTYALSITPMAGKFTAGGIAVDIYKNGALWKTVSTADSKSTFSFDTGKFAFTVNRSELNSGDVLQLVLKDINSSAFNYRDETSNQSADLGEVNPLHAWVLVPGAITDTGTLSLAITPLTELAHRNMGSPDTGALPSEIDINGANNAVAKAFGLQQDGLTVDLVHTAPVATNDATFKNADANAQAYGNALALISSLALKNNAVEDTGKAPTAAALSAALTQLQDANADSSAATFALSPAAQTKLSEAVIHYNKTETNATKLPGVALTDAVGLDGSVSLYDYETNGLEFKLYAPAGKKAGDTVTLKFQAYKADGSLDDSQSFSFDYQLQSKVATTDKAYDGEIVSLPRLVESPDDISQVSPLTDANGKNLLGIAGLWADGLRHYKVSIDGVTSLGSYQDFKLNPSPIHIANTSNDTPQGYVKAGDTVQVDVVLDQDVFWGVGGAAAPILMIQYTDSTGALQTKEASLDPSTGKGHVLSFKFEFGAMDNAKGAISVLDGALTGVVRGASGSILDAYLEMTPTSVADSKLVADTTLPPSVKLVEDTSSPDASLLGSIDGTHTAQFIKTNTPTLKVMFMEGAGGQTPSETLTSESSPVTVQLFAYIDDRSENSIVIATTTVARGASAVFKPEHYTTAWKNKPLDADGQAYKFYAKVVDAAGNESNLIAQADDLALWLDTQAPNVASLTFDAAGSAQTNVFDPISTDNQTNNKTPKFVVTGEAGSTVKLYTVPNADGSGDPIEVLIAASKTSGFVGDGNTSASITPSAALSDGTYYFVTTLKDAAGNTSGYSKPVAVVIDTALAKTVTLAIENAPSTGYYKAGDTIDISATFDEAVYLDPSKSAPELTFKSKTDGSDLRALLKAGTASGSGTHTLHFSYTVPADHSADSTGIPFGIENISFFNANSLVDHVGNTMDAVPELTVTALAQTLQIDTAAPSAPTVVMGPDVLGVVSAAEAKASSGLVKVTAEAGSQVQLTFSTDASGAPKTITKQIASASATGDAVALTDADLAALGVASTQNASITVKAKATDAAGNVGAETSLPAFTLDTMAPAVSTAVVAAGTPSIIGHSDSATIRSVNFTVTFSEAFASGIALSKDHFVIDGGLGTVNKVDPGTTSNSYIVNATPVDESHGTMVLKLLANGGGVQLKDAAGNLLADALLNTSGLTAQQAFDTQAPTVKSVVDNTAESVTNKATLIYTVEFSEPTQALGNVKPSFRVTHGTVTDVQPDTTTGSAATGYTKYIVTVQTQAGVSTCSVELSLQLHNEGAFADAYGNTVVIPSGGLSLVNLGGKQDIDTKAPEAPLIALNAAVTDNTVSKAEALTDLASGGIVKVTAEAGSQVEVTFSTAASGALKTKTKTIASASATGDVVTLTDADLADLGVASTQNASITVKAKATDAAGNVGAEASLSAFTLDSVAPVVSTVTGASTSTAGPTNVSFTVTLSETLNSDLSAANFALKDATLGTIASVTKSSSDAKQYTVVVTPAQGKTGDIALTLKGNGVTDVAGNPLLDADLSGLNKQTISTVAPKVLSVTDDFASEWANANSTIRYTVTFDKALSTASMTADQLKAAFTDVKGEVQSVTRSSDKVYVVSVKPTANQDDAYMSLNIVADKLVDALGNKVEAASLSSFDSQRVDTMAPVAPSIALNAASDTGDKDGKFTSVTAPQFDLTGLETNATVTVYQDKDNNGAFNSGDTLLWRGTATGASTTTPAITQALADGRYTDIHVSQTDAHGNVGSSAALPELVIQSQAPSALSNLVFDATQDTTASDGAVLPSGSRDYRTYTPVPTFSFEGGTVNGTAVLFLDKNRNNSFDAGEELGRATIQEGASNTISVDPLHALSQGTYGPTSSRGQIGIFEINAAGVQGAVSMLNLSPADADVAITGLTINPAPAQSITVESAQASGLTNQATLAFNVKTGGQLGGTITVTADAVDAATGNSLGTAVTLGTVASPSGSGTITLDISSLAAAGSPVKYTNFKAYQTYAGVRSSSTADISFTGGSTANTVGVTLDHAAPTVRISADKALLLKDETAQLTFSFSEKVTDFTAADIDGLDGGTVTAPVTTDDGKTWTATFTPKADSTTPVSLSLKADAVKDAALNTNATASASINTPLALTVNTPTQVAPTNTVPSTDPSASVAAVVGSAYAISGVSVADNNHNLASVTLSVDNGTLAISPTSGVTITGTGTTASPLIVTVNAGITGAAATSALNEALAKLMFTASAAGSATLTILSTDTAVGTAAALTDSDTLTLANITAAPAAPVNSVPASLTTTSTAIVAGLAYNFTDSSSSNALSVSDVNHDITKVELSVAKGTLSIDTAGLTGVTLSGSGTSALTVTVTAGTTGTAATAALNAALAKLSYTANGTAATSDTLTIKTTDARNTSDTDTVALTVNAAPIAPVNTVPSAAAVPNNIITGQAQAITGISVTDGDNNLSKVELSVNNGSLSVAATTGVTITGAGTAASPLTLTPTGAGAAANTALNAALAKLSYTSNSGYAGVDTLTVKTTDSTAANLGGAKTDTDTLALNVNPAPIAPVNTVPSTLDTASKAVIVGTSFNFKESGNTISVADGDNNLASVKLSVTKGTLSIDTAGLTGVTLSGSGTSVLTVTVNADITGAAATTALNAALDKLSYTSNAGYTGADSLTVLSTDGTALRFGGAKTDTDTMAFTVNAAPIAPVNSVPSTLTGVLTGQAKAITGITVSDADNNLASVTLSVGHGTLGVTSSAGVTVENNNSATVTLKGANATQLNAVLATLSYTAISSYTGTDSLTVVTADSTAANLGGPKTNTNTLADFQVLAAPVNTLVAPSGVKGGTAINLTGLNVADADDNIASVKLQVTDGVLSTTTSTGVTSADSGRTLTFTGTKTAINEALATLSYTYANQHGKTGVSLTMTSTDSSAPAALTDVDTVSFNVAQADNVSPAANSVTITSNTDGYSVGTTLSANTSALTSGDTNGVGAFTYEWTRSIGSTSTVVGTNSATYAVTGADAGATLSVKVSYTDGAGYPESHTSAATTAITWPSSLALNSAGSSAVSLSFYDDPASASSQPSVLSTAAGAKFIALQQLKYYVLDVNGDGVITSADKTTYASGLASSDSSITTASGAKLQLLSKDEWSSLMTGGDKLNNTLPSVWFGGSDTASTADYWTRDIGSSSASHLVYTPSTNSASAVANDASAFNASGAYHYNVFQVLG